MARRRADGGSFSFDLIPDDDTSVVVVPAEPSRPSRGLARGLARGLGRVMRAAGSRVRSWPRRRVVAGVTVVGVLAAGGLGTAVVTAQARQRAWAQTAATAPGAVLDLGHEPVEAWRIDLGGPFPIGMLGDRLIVQEQHLAAGADGPTLHGIDLTVGEVAWSTTVPGVSECTVSTRFDWWGATQRVPRGEAVVCLSAAQRTVGVVDRDGDIVASRQLADRAANESVEGGQEGGPSGADRWSMHRVLVMPTAELLRIGSIGLPGPPPAIGRLESDGSVSGARSATLMEPFVNRDVRVRIEDAATGAVRWEVVLDAADLPAGGRVPESSPCLTWQGSGDEVAFDSGFQWFDSPGARTLSLRRCGLDVDLDLETGKILEQGDAFAPGYVPVQTISSSLDDGGWVDTVSGPTSPTGGQSATSRIMRADGTVVGEVPAVVFPPLATDGPDSALLTAIAMRPDGLALELQAYDADDASLLWSVRAPSLPRILARTVDVVVITDGAVVAGLDWETGETLWEHDLYDGDVQGDGGYAIADAVTDGRRVAVVAPSTPNSYQDMQSGEKVTTALDLATGEVVWTTTGSEPVPFAIAGRLYRFENDALVALE